MAEAERKIRILFVIRSLGNGGAERQLVTLAIGLHELGHKIEVASFYPGGIYETELTNAGVPVTCLNKQGRWDVFGFFQRLMALTRSRRPDVVYSYMTSANIFTALIRPFFRHPLIIWGLRSSNVDANLYNWAVGVSMRGEAILSRFTNLIIANSDAGKKFAISQGFPADKIVVIHNGIDTRKFRPDARSRARFRQVLSIDDQVKIVGLVGRIDPIKGYETFIKAAALVHKRQPDIKFICVGHGPETYQLKLREQANALNLGNALIWTGPYDDMTMVYNGIDLLCMVSTSEGFPNVVAEAMACGMPCVVTNVGDAARIVGDMGRVIPPAAPIALADAIQDSLANLISSQELREKITKEFSINKLFSKNIKAIKHMLLTHKASS